MPSILCSYCKNRILLPTPVHVCPHCGTSFTVPGSSASAAGGASASSRPPTPLPPPPSSAHSPKGAASSAPPVKAKTARRSASRAPDLEGIVAAPPHRDIIEKPSDWSQIVLQILFFLFTLPFLLRNLFRVRGGRPRSTMAVHTLRIRRSDGTFGEARFEGDFTASIPAQGDRVSLWGTSRAGILIVKRAYNHSTGAKIKTSGSPRLWLSRVAAIALPVLIVALLYLYAPLIPSILSALGTFLIMGFVIYFLIVIFVPWIPRRIVPYVVGFFLLYAVLSVCTHMSAHPHP